MIPTVGTTNGGNGSPSNDWDVFSVRISGAASAATGGAPDNKRSAPTAEILIAREVRPSRDL
jgi:hypothetical protein